MRRLVFLLVAMSMAVTMLRLIGELRGWPERWFSRDTGGIIPSGVAWVAGVTWLPIPIGFCLALKLRRLGRPPARHLGAALCVAMAWTLAYVALFVAPPQLGFEGQLIYSWSVAWVCVGLVGWSWPELLRPLLAYAVATRLFVVLVMLVAMSNNWGTHYDLVGVRLQREAGFWMRFLWFALLPQVLWWVPFSVLLGSASGALTLVRRRRQQAKSR